MEKQSPAQPDEEARGANQRAERQAVKLAAFVIAALGEPPDFLRVTVVKVWGDHFRVNVHAGADVTSARVVHSYFLTVADNGQVVGSEPAITRLY
jgi:hypothetical protein